MQINLVPDPSLLAIVVIFFLNYLVVRRFFLKPLNDIMETREKEQTAAERMYVESMARLEEATMQMEQRLQVAKREAAAVRDRHRADAAAHRARTVERTQGEARQIVGEAEQKLSHDVAAARDKIKRESESLARLAAERLLGRAV
jgi:F-type H+-transporting ATPase subunit b